VPRRRIGIERAGAIARRLLRGAPLGDAPPPPPDAGGRLGEAFRRAAGEIIAAHARPRALKNGVLHIAVDGPVWMQELSFLRKEIAAKVTRVLGEPVRDLKLSPERVRAVPVARPARRAQVEAAPAGLPALPPEVMAEIERATQALAADPELREAASRALTWWRARQSP
jgi:hypothetical protein